MIIVNGIGELNKEPDQRTNFGVDHGVLTCESGSPQIQCETAVTASC